MYKITLIIAALFCLTSTGTLHAEESVKEPLEAAKSWLTLVDQGKYEESWQESCTLSKRSFTVDEWKKAVTDARERLGNVKSRELSSTEVKKTLPGMPDGQYVVVQYKTTFDKKEQGAETVMLMLDKDGKWRSAGYYVK